MNNRKKAMYLVGFIAALFVIIAAIAIAEHLPIIGKLLVTIPIILLIIFVITFFVILIRRQNK